MLLSKDKIYKTLLYLYFILLPIIAAAESISSGSNKIFNGIFMVFLAFAVIDLYRRSYVNKYIVLFLLFSFSIFLSNFAFYGFGFAGEYESSMGEGTKIGFRILMLALLTYFSYLLTRFEVLKMKELMTISIYLVFSMILSQVLGTDNSNVVSGAGNELALQGLVSHVAITSSILLSVLPILLINSKKSTLNFIMLGLCYLAILFTFRRSAWVIFFILGLVHVYMMYFKNHTDAFQKFKVMGLVVAGFVGIIAFLTLNQDVTQAIMVRLDDLNFSNGGTGAGRTQFWSILWDYILSQPLMHYFIGNGFGFIQGLLENNYGMAIGAHNDWLDIFIAFGIFPTILFATMIFVLFSDIFQSNRVYRQLLAYSVFSLLALSLMTGGAFDTYFAFLHVTIGFALASHDNTVQSKYID